MLNKIIIKCFLAPGDIVVLTGALRELKRCYPEIELGVLTPYPEITFGNPIFTLYASKDKNVPIIDIDYLTEFNNKDFSGNHIIDGFITCLNEKLNLNIKKINMYPDIRLTEEELNNKKEFLNNLGIEEPYWLISPGIKNDMPLKAWNPKNWQALIDYFNYSFTTKYKLIQIGSENYYNPEFKDVKSLVGKTENLRDLIQLCAYAQGSIGGISLHMHLMAAFKKPSIIIAGGRESIRWFSYPNHTVLHSIGRLSCCKLSGCWKKQRNECVNMNNVTHYPLCMKNITIENVIKSLIFYS